MHSRSRFEKWRDAQSPISKGCGCIALVAIGLLACAFMMGALMGDYFGPPEGRAHDIEVKNTIILRSLGVLTLCALVGSWLIKKRRF